MGQVTYANTFSESRNNIVSLVTAGVSDPITTSAEYRKWIYSRRPDTKASDFGGYPLIIINPSMVNVERDLGTADGKSKVTEWEIEIEIMTSDRGYGSADGQGLTHMDSISNNIQQVLMDASNRATLRNQGMSQINSITSNVDTDVINDELIYRRLIVVGFTTRFTVSA